MTIDKEKLDSIFNELDKEKSVAILVHDSPDPDCLGSAAGFEVLLKEVYKLNSEIYYFGTISHAQNRSIKNVLHINLKDGNDFNGSEVSAVIALDTDIVSTGFKDKVNKVDVRLDHHLTECDIETCLKDIRMVGSTSTIVYDYLKDFGISLETYPEVATGLFLGIKTDTLDLVSANTTELDMEAFRELLPFVDKSLLAKVMNYTIPQKAFEIEAIAFKNRRVENTTLVSFVGEIGSHNRDLIAIIADRFSRMEGISTVVILGVIKNSLIASVRTSDDKVEVSALCSSVFGQRYSGAKEGSGGAKLPLGAGYELINDEEIKEKVLKEIVVGFEEKIFNELGEK